MDEHQQVEPGSRPGAAEIPVGRGRPSGRTSVGESRRDEVVKVAYRLIAEKGFEGFRTRQVAEEAGINVATLHYYFPTKEALVQGVVDYLIASFGSAVPSAEEAPTAVEELRYEFDDTIRRFRETPEQYVVMAELAARSWRDPAVAEILGAMNEGWQAHLCQMLRRGVDEGVFRADVDVDQVARALMVQLTGIGYQVKLGVDRLEPLINLIADQILAWLAA